MKFEERRVRRILARNTLLFFAAFAVLFSLFGVLVFQLVSANVYRTADAQLGEVRDVATAVAVDPAADGIGSEPASGATAEIREDIELVPQRSEGEGDGGADVSAESIIITSEAYVASNPQLIYLWRDADGKPLDTSTTFPSTRETSAGCTRRGRAAMRTGASITRWTIPMAAVICRCS